MKSKLLTIVAILSLNSLAFAQVMTNEELAKYELKEYVDSLISNSQVDPNEDIQKTCISCQQPVDLILEFDHLSQGKENSGSSLSNSFGGSMFFACSGDGGAEVMLSNAALVEKGITQRPRLLFQMTNSRCEKMSKFLNELPKEKFRGDKQSRLKVCVGLNFPNGTAQLDNYYTYNRGKENQKPHYSSPSEYLQVIYTAKECTTNNIMNSKYFLVVK